MPSSPDPVLENARALVKEETEAALGTLEGEIPFVSATSYLFEAGEGEAFGTFYLFLSRLARHTKNLHQNRTVSLLIVQNNPEIPIQERARVTVIGEIQEVDSSGEEKEWLREKYQKQFPGSEILFSLPDFRFYRLNPKEIHWVGGFGKVRSFTLAQ